MLCIAENDVKHTADDDLELEKCTLSGSRSSSTQIVVVKADFIALINPLFIPSKRRRNYVSMSAIARVIAFLNSTTCKNHPIIYSVTPPSLF